MNTNRSMVSGGSSKNRSEYTPPVGQYAKEILRNPSCSAVSVVIHPLVFCQVMLRVWFHHVLL